MKTKVLLSMNDMNSKEKKRKVTRKLHRHLRHPTSVKLIELLKNADINEKEICVIIEKIVKFAWNTKNPQQIRPVAGFPSGTEFNKCVTMDLKRWFYQQKVWLIHIVDHFTQ